MLFENWRENLEPLIQKYKGRKHPLAYQNIYQLLIMVLLSARDSDANINKVTIAFFKKYTAMDALSTASIDEITTYIQSVTNYNNKAKWIFEIATILKTDENIKKLN